jgi:hypothetical protein
MFTFPSVFFSKMSILLLYLRIFTIKPHTCTAIYMLMVLNAGTYLPSLVIFPYFCSPRIGESWTAAIAYQCSNKSTVWTQISAALAVALDIFIFILPLPLLRGLQLSPKKKRGVMLTFLTASL